MRHILRHPRSVLGGSFLLCYFLFILAVLNTMRPSNEAFEWILALAVPGIPWCSITACVVRENLFGPMSETIGIGISVIWIFANAALLYVIGQQLGISLQNRLPQRLNKNGDD